MSLYCFLTILLWTGRLGIGMNGRIRIGIGGRFTQEYAVRLSSPQFGGNQDGLHQIIRR